MRACLRNGWFRSRAAAASAPIGQLDLDPLVAQDPRARGRSPSRSDRRSAITTRAIRASRIALGARRLPAVVGAGLERHVHGRAGGSTPRPRHASIAATSAWAVAELGVKALADHLAVAHEHRADERVGAHLPAASLGQLQRPPQLDTILLCDHRGHRLDRTAASVGAWRAHCVRALIDWSVNQIVETARRPS